MRYLMWLIGFVCLVACNAGSNDNSVSSTEATQQATAQEDEAMIASAKSAGPPSVTSKATIKAPDGKILHEGSSSYTCYPQQAIIGPMCNEAVWDSLIGAMLKKEAFEPDKFSVSYMLAGEGTALGVSNSDPYATEPDKSDDWVKEGPHLMIAVPNSERPSRDRGRRDGRRLRPPSHRPNGQHTPCHESVDARPCALRDRPARAR